MKGMMVSLLVLLTTGMVVGQQPTNPADSNQNGRFLLDMTDEWIDSLVENGYLRAPIQPNARDRINQVDLRYASAASRNLEPAQIVQVATSETGVLNFEINDRDLNLMKQRGLRYTIRNEDRGKYEIVAIKYTGFVGPRANPANTQKNDFASGSSNRETTPPANTGRQVADSTRGNDAFNRRPVAGTENERRRIDSTRIPENDRDRFDNRRQTTNNFPTESRQREETRQTVPVREKPMSEFDKWAQQQKNKLDENVAQTKATVADKFDFSSGAVRGTRPNERQVQQGQSPVNDRWRYLDQQEYDNRFDNQTTQTNQDVRAVDLERLRQQRLAEENERSEQQRLANLEYQADQLEKQRKEKEIEERLAYELRMKDLQDIADLKRERERYAMVPSSRYPYTDDRRPVIEYETNRFPERRRQDFVDPLDDYDADYDRVAQLPPQTTGARQPRQTAPVPFSINGPNQPTATANKTPIGGLQNENIVLADQTQLTRLNQQNKLLWFMMLCSLGLNIYLGWIARSFFGRYEELADELRETFTSSV